MVELIEMQHDDTETPAKSVPSFFGERRAALSIPRRYRRTPAGLMEVGVSRLTSRPIVRPLADADNGKTRLRETMSKVKVSICRLFTTK